MRVLVAPLHWGLGHAARCIPIIRDQLQQGNEVIIAASGAQRALLEEHFPNALYIDIPFMEITLPEDGNMLQHFRNRAFRFVQSIWKEHRLLDSFIKEHRIDQVISDSRFGLWNGSIKSVIITHQLHIKTPVFEGLINVLNGWVLSKYDEIWVPDVEANPGLGGELSHPKKSHGLTVKYLGPLSRFRAPILPVADKEWDLLALISGPEPQRSMFEADIMRQSIESGERTLIIQGKPDVERDTEIDGIRTVNHMADDALQKALASTKRIVSRSGYSTIMDFSVLGLTATYIPTPGQTEQEYLAVLHNT